MTGADLGLHELFAREAARREAAEAVSCGARRLSYGEVERRANRLARFLRSRGVGTETLVGLYLERSVETIVAILGVLKAGGAYVPIDLAAPRERRDFLLRDAGVALVLSAGRPAGDLADCGAAVIDLDARGGEIARQPATAPPDGMAGPEQLAYVIYTSGSTGRPKGVRVSHRNVTRLFAACRRWFDFGPADVWTLCHSYAFDFSVWELWGALLHGGRLVVVPYQVSRSASELWDLVLRERVTVLNQTPSAFSQLLPIGINGGAPGAGHPGAAALRWVIFGGEALEVRSLGPWWQRHGAARPRLVNMYGITETTVHVTCRPLGPEDLNLAARSCIGVPLPDLTVHLLDAAGAPVPEGAAGELYVGGAGVARGYLNRPDLEAERLLPDPFGGILGARLYRTGDRARRLPSGDLDYLGRLDHQVKIRGYRIETGEIESVLAAHPAVAGCAVVVRDGGQDDRRLAAFLVPADPAADRRRLAGEARELARRRLPDYMVPASWTVLAALPLTGNGKVDRAALAAADGLPQTIGGVGGAGEADGDGAAPRGQVEELLALLWSRVLGVERVGADADFFALGGHSLLVPRVIAQVREAFGVELAPRDLFAAPTVAGLAAHIAAAQRGGREGPSLPPLVPVPRAAAGSLPLSFAQRRLWFLDRLAPGRATYNVAAAFALDPAPEPAALAGALTAIVRRHEALRTRFVARDGEPWQEVDPPAPVPLPLVDLGAGPGRRLNPAHQAPGRAERTRSALDTELQRLRAEEARRPFDLARGPLLRAILVRLDGGRHVLLLTLHHIVYDGWSEGLLLAELSILHGAVVVPRTTARSAAPAVPAAPAASREPATATCPSCVRRRPGEGSSDGAVRASANVAIHRAPLPPLPVQYADFAVWQRSWPAGLLDDQRAYWRRQLQGAPPALDLPLDLPRPAVQSFRGASRTLLLPAAATARLRQAARREGVTLYMLLLAGFGALLARHSGLDDLLIGTPVANRTRPEIERLIGFFVNTLPLRLGTAGDPELGAFLAAVRATTLAAFAHQDVPFELLVEELRPERAPSRSPLVEVLLAYQSAGQAAMEGLAAAGGTPVGGRGALRLTRLPPGTTAPVGSITPIASVAPVAAVAPVTSAAPVVSAESIATTTTTTTTGGIASIATRATTASAKFDLSLAVTEVRVEGDAAGPALALELEYATDLFTAATAARLLTHYATLLDGAAAALLGHGVIGPQDDGALTAPDRGTLVPVDGGALAPDGDAMAPLDRGALARLDGGVLAPLDGDAPARLDSGTLTPLNGGPAPGRRRLPRLSDLPLLSPAERHQLTAAWNDTASRLPERPLHRLFEEQAEARPDAVAVQWGQGHLSYAELDRQAGRIARRLRRLGVGTEARVGLCMERSGETVAALLGILKAGGAYLPLDPAHPRERLELLLADAAPAAVVGTCELLAALPGDAPRLALKGPAAETLTRVAATEAPASVQLWTAAGTEPPAPARTAAGAETPVPIPGRAGTEAEPRTEVPAPAEPLAATGHPDRTSASDSADTLAYVLYTSGSTGTPKAVAVTHRAVVRLVRDTDYMAFGPGEVFLQLAPLSFDAATLELWGPLLHGGRLVLHPPRPFSLADLRDVLNRCGVTTLWLTAGLFHLAVEEDVECLAGLRQLLAGGDALSRPHVERALAALPAVELIDGYGPTENTTFSSTCRLRAALATQQPGEVQVPIGRPIAGSTIHLLDRTLQPVPAGCPGEIFAGGAGVARGYLNRPDLTAWSFVPDPFAPAGGPAGARLYRTGDLARQRPDGTLEFLGRRDFQVKVRGFRIEPGEVEAALLRHPAVREAAVVAHAEGARDHRLVAFYAAAEPHPDPAALRAFLRERLPEQMMPAAFVPLPALPLTPSGKVDRRALSTVAGENRGNTDPYGIAGTADSADASPDGAGSRAGRHASGAPASQLEELIAGIWQEVLGRPAGVNENFFDLGGHSLLVTRVLSRLARTLGMELPVQAFFQAPTVRGLARLAARGRQQGEEAPPALPPLVPVPRPIAGADDDAPAPGMPLSFAQRRLWFLDRLAPGTATYNVPAALALHPPFAPAALAEALAAVVRRHEALRTRFVARDGEPWQRIDPPAPVPLPTVDLSALPRRRSLHSAHRGRSPEARNTGDAADTTGTAGTIGTASTTGATVTASPTSAESTTGATGTAGTTGATSTIDASGAAGTAGTTGATGATSAELRRLRAAEAGRPFDLARGPLLRATLVRLGTDEAVLLLTLHHIVYDGWSEGLLLAELSVLHAAALRRLPLSGRGLAERPLPPPRPGQAEEPPPLRPLPLQYADFAAWQRAWPAGLLDAQLAHWRSQLQGAPPALDLPLDHRRPPVQSFRGGSRALLLPAGTAARLRQAARREGATLYMLLLAGFAALLARHSGLDDLLIGTPVANRIRPEIEGLVGFFVNTLPLRVQVGGDPDLHTLLAAVRGTALTAFAHQEIPFEMLVEELRPERDPSRNPLVQVLLAFQSAGQAAGQELAAAAGGAAAEGRGALRWTRLPSGTTTTAKFDLSLMVAEKEPPGEGGEPALTLELEYATDLFTAATAVRFLEHYATLLGAAATALLDGGSWALLDGGALAPRDSGALAPRDRRAPAPLHGGALARRSPRLSDLPLLSPAERHQLTAEWNDTASSFPRRTLHRLFEEQAAARPDAIAVHWEEGQLSYAELDRRAGRIARRLRRLGVGTEARVGLCMERSGEMVAALLGILKAGAAYLPLDPAYPRERLELLLADAAPAAVAGTRALLAALPGNAPRLILEGTTAETRGTVEAAESPPSVQVRTAAGAETSDDPDTLAYVLYTSGSTGTPKAVAVTHRAVVRLVRETDYMAFGPGEVFLQMAPMSFDAATLELWGPLLHGGRLTIYPPRPFSLAELRSVVARYGVTFLWLTTGLFHLAVEESGDGLADFSGLRQLATGGDVLSRPHIERVLAALPAVELFVAYGPTENTTFSSTCRPCAAFALQEPGDSQVPLGRPIAGSRLHLLDHALQPVPAGCPGEIFAGGAGLARGYLDRPGLTAWSFVPDPFAPPGEPAGARLYRTGDLARQRPDGTLEFLGRRDFQVKVRGFRIEPGEVEGALLRHPAVREAAVVARAEGARDYRLVAFYVAAEPHPDPAGLRAFLRQRLPEHMVPAAFVPLPALPLTSSGKVDRRALAAAPVEGTSTAGLAGIPIPGTSATAPDGAGHHAERRAPEAPGSQLEELIAGIWQEVLGRPAGLEDSFFDLGGHSLLVTRVLARLSRALAVDIPVQAFFQAPTVRGLARLAARGRQQGEEAPPALPPLVPVPRPIASAAADAPAPGMPLSFAQRRLWFLDRLAPGTATYNVPAAFALHPPFAPAALAEALAAVVRRHEALRTRFVARDGEPWQRIDPPAPVPLPTVDLTALPRRRNPHRPDHGPHLEGNDIGAAAGTAGTTVTANTTGATGATDITESTETTDTAGTPCGAGTTDKARATDTIGAELRRLRAAEAGRPFDLARGPLLRATLVCLGTDEAVLLLTLHHIVYDGWSEALLLAELSVLHAAALRRLASPPRPGQAEEPPPLRPLPLQYADFAAWQRAWPAGLLAAQLTHWRRQLQGAPPALDLPLDRPRPPVQSFRGGSRRRLLAPGTAARLRQAARREGATLYMLLLAGFAAVLSRHSGLDDLTIGTPVANRTRPEIEGLIGFFVNTLPLRLRTAGDSELGAFLAAVRETALAAFAHQDLPFEMLVEELRPERDPSRNPIVQVLLSYQGAGRAATTADTRGALRWTRLPLGAMTTAKFDLSLAVTEEEEEAIGGAGPALALELEYATDLFTGATATRLLAHYATLLDGAAAALLERGIMAPRDDGASTPPESGAPAPRRRLRLSDLPLLSPAERHQLVVGWNDTASPFPERTIHHLFEEQAAARPDAVAVHWEHGQLSYAELDRRAARIARRLRRLGAGTESRVGLCMERSGEMVAALLGILKAGAAYLPLDAAYPRERLELLLADATPAAVVGAREALAALPGLAPRLVLGGAAPEGPGDGEAAGDSAAGVETHSAATSADLAYVLYTSGSTGTPKAVAVTHRAVVRLVRDTDYMAFGPGEVFLQLAPMSFDLATLELWGPLLHGGRLVLHPPRPFSLADLRDVLNRCGVTTLWLTAGLFHLAVEEDVECLAGLRQLLAGGDALSRPHVERALAALPAVELIDGYGPTENTTFSSACRLRGALAAPGPAPGQVPIGRPIAGSTIHLLDRTLQPVPAGCPGEIFAGGAGVARGYLNRPGLTAWSFVPDPFAPPGEPAGARLYRTGDLARQRPDGTLEFLGRRDFQVKVRGFRIEPGEVEAALLRHPAVREAAVVARAEGARDHRLVAFYAAAEPGPDPAALRAFLRQRLPEHMVPAAFVPLPALPLSPSGKVDRRALATVPAESTGTADPAGTSRPAGSADAALDGAGHSAERHPAAARGSQIEELIAGAWEEVLGRPAGLHDNFFDLGGHSLLVTRVLSRLTRALGVELPVQAFFQAPTVSGLARLAARARGGGAAAALSPLVPVPRTAGPEGGFPLSFAQQRLWFLDRLAPGTPTYNVPAAWAIEPPIEPAELAAALTALVHRHEVLRTRFEEAEGEPRQVIDPPAPVPLPVVNLSALPPSRRPHPGDPGSSPGSEDTATVANAATDASEAGTATEASSASTASRELQRLRTAEAVRPFDLAQGPLLRATLVRTGADRTVLLLTLHHIVYDGWSEGLLLTELSALHAAAAACRRKPRPSEPQPSPLRPLPLQYADFAAWQRAWPVGLLDAQLAHWRRQLQGAPPTLDLPLDRPRPSVQSFRGGNRALPLSAATATRLRQAARREGVTLYMLLLASFGALLTRHTGLDDLVLGTPVANRTRPEVEGLIGFFVNTLPLRLCTADDPELGALLAAVRDTALAAFAHQDLPFEMLVEELHPERDPSRNPLVQVLLIFQRAAFQELAAAGGGAAGDGPGALRWTRLPLPGTRTAKFDLSMAVTEAEGPGAEPALALELEYADLFTAATAARLLTHYATLLDGAASALLDEGGAPLLEAGRRLRLSDLPLLSPAERHQLTAEWNDTASRLPERPLHRLFEEQAAARPDAVAVHWEQGHLTYAGLDRRAGRIARRLRRLGVGTEARVGLCMERSGEMVAALLGILKAGAAYLPLDPTYPRERLELLLADAAPAAVAGTRALLATLPGNTPRLILEGTTAETRETGEAAEAPPSGDPDTLAYVLYTSGSTGTPKAVAVTHRAVVRLVRGTDYMALGPCEVFLQLAPLSFDAATLELWGPLLHGGRLVLHPPRPFSLADLRDVLNRCGVTTLWLTAGLFHLAVEEDVAALAGLRQLLAGGDALSRPHVERALAALPAVELIDGYGPTENTTFSSTCRLRAALATQHPGEAQVPIGRPIAGSRVHLLDRTLQPVPAGCPGEIFAGGAGVARGYLNHPGLTAWSFVPDPFAPPGGPVGARLYRTGDLARQRSDGTLEFLGRRDFQVKVRGFRIEPGEVEAALLSHPAVREAAVVARAEGARDHRLVAFYATAEPHPDPAALRAFLRQRLPEHMVPAAFVPLPTLPLTPSGKVDRRALSAVAAEGTGTADPASSARRSDTADTANSADSADTAPDGAGHRAGRHEPEAPGSQLEELIAGAWEEVLGRPIGLHDNFFDLGGHSLLVTRVLSRLARTLGIELPVQAFFQAPTVHGLAHLAAQIRTPEAPAAALPPLVPVPRPTFDASQGAAPAMPLSYAQRRLWFLDLLAPGSAAYNIPAAFALRPPFAPAALAAALTAAVRRHEALRTRFAAVEGEPWQRIDPPAPVPLPVVDLSTLPRRRRPQPRDQGPPSDARDGGDTEGAANEKLRRLRAVEAELQRLRAAEAARPFDLARGPLLRATLVRLGTDEAALLLTLHHIVYDGWSEGLLLRELSILHAAALERRPARLPRLPLQYADFASWQRAWPAAALAGHLDYWRGQLEDPPEPLQLPSDLPPRQARQQPGAAGARGACRELCLEPAATLRLHQLARREGVTLYMLLLAVLATLLGRLTGREDLLVGSPVANRARPELEGLIGCFVNLVVLRLPLRGEPRLRPLLAAARETVLGALAHQNLPFEALVRELRPERGGDRSEGNDRHDGLDRNEGNDHHDRNEGNDLGAGGLGDPGLQGRARAPLLQVVLNWLSAERPAAPAAALFAPLPLAARTTAKFDLALAAEETADAAGAPVLVLQMEYAADLFSAPLAARLLAHLANLLQGAADAPPDLPVSQLPLLGGAERHQLLAEWNDTARAWPRRPLVHELFAAHAARRPRATAVASPLARLTYGDLDRRAGRLARALRRRGIGPEALVAVCTGRTLERVVGIVGVLKAGGAYVSLDPAYPPDRLAFLLRDSGARVLLTEERHLARLPASEAEVVLLDRLVDEAESEGGGEHPGTGDAAPPAAEVTPQNLAYVVYTSGSTGQPKGVAIPHAGLLNLVHWYQEQFGLRPGDRGTQIASPAFDASVVELWPFLAGGAELHIPDEATRLSAPSMVRWWSEVGVTLAYLMTPLAEGVLEELRLHPDLGRGLPVRSLFTGGDRLHHRPGAAVGFRLWNTYGPAEYSVTTSAVAVAPAAEGVALPSIGRPLPNTRVHVLDARMNPLPVGVPGELCVAGVGLARGYLGRPELTAERFVPDPWSGEPGARMYRTADLVRLLPDGDVDFLDRVDHQVKLRGHRIELGEIENVLARHPAVREAVVVLRRDAAGGRRLVAYVVPAAGPALAWDELRAYLQARLPDYMVPRAGMLLPELPLSANGKVDRRALPEVREEREPAPPETETEALLVEIWQGLLGCRVGVYDNLFDLGAHSMLAPQFVARVHAVFYVDLPLTALFEGPSVKQLAVAIQESLLAQIEALPEEEVARLLAS